MASRSEERAWFWVQVLTLARLPLSLILVLLLITTASDDPIRPHGPLLIAIAFVIMLANELTDLADGMVTRRFGVTSEIGAMLDPYADSISRIVVYFGLAQTGYLSPWVPLAMAFRDITVAYSRVVFTRTGISVGAKLSGKIKAWVLAVGSFLALLGPLYWPYVGTWTRPLLSWVIGISVLASMVQYTWQAVELMMEERAQIRRGTVK